MIGLATGRAEAMSLTLSRVQKLTTNLTLSRVQKLTTNGSFGRKLPMEILEVKYVSHLADL